MPLPNLIVTPACGLLAAILAAGTAWAEPSQQLTCHAPDPIGQSLCAAIRTELLRRNYESIANLQVELWAKPIGTAALSARLRVTRPSLVDDGAEIVLSVTDQHPIPQASIRALASRLLDHAGL